MPSVPHIALDPLAGVVATVELNGKTYDVTEVTGAAYSGAVAIQAMTARQETPDPEIIFQTARACVPGMPDAEFGRVTIKQAMAILLAASGRVAVVEQLFPKEKAAAGSRRGPRRTTR